MVAIITTRVPNYTQSLHRARTAVGAPSMSLLENGCVENEHWGKRAHAIFSTAGGLKLVAKWFGRLLWQTISLPFGTPPPPCPTNNFVLKKYVRT